MEETKTYQPHQQRVVDEKAELEDKVTKLGAFILDNPIYGNLEEEDKDLMNEQLKCMEGYLSVLEKRIAKF